VSWNNNDNKLIYTTGTLQSIERVYIKNDGQITLGESEDILPLEILYDFINEARYGEAREYAIAKIGTQYWMAEDLRTSKYANGDEISLGSDFTDITAKYGTSQFDTYYYNSAAILKSLLIPDGFRISTMKDWDILKEYINDNAMVLKKGDDWSAASSYTATNLTGFSSETIGLYNGDFRDSFSASYWKVDNSNKTKASKVVTISTNNKLNETDPKDIHGLAIRCIKE